MRLWCIVRRRLVCGGSKCECDRLHSPRVESHQSVYANCGHSIAFGTYCATERDVLNFDVRSRAWAFDFDWFAGVLFVASFAGGIYLYNIRRVFSAKCRILSVAV